MKKFDYTPRKKFDPILDIKYAVKGTLPKPVKTINKTIDDTRSTKHINSLVTPGHSTAPKVIPKCTLPNLIGISIVHKSCLVPVFSADEAKDLAKMRR
jgi:hypothetical protein